MQLAPSLTIRPTLVEPLCGTGAHPAVEAWTALTGDPVLPAVEILKYKNKSKVFRLRRPGVNSPAVIAKWCQSETATIEKFIYDEVLSRLPGPVLRCHGSLPEATGEFTWVFLEDASGREYSREAPSDRALAGRWLAILHNQSFASTRGLTATLPDRSPNHYLQILRAARKLLREHEANPLLRAGDVSTFQSIIAQCDFLEEHWSELSEPCEAAPRVVVHGDLVTKNVRVQQGRSATSTASPGLLVFDWENAGWGIAGTDLAQAERRALAPDPNAYLETLDSKTRFSRANLRRVVECGRVFRLLDSIRWAALMLDCDSYESLIVPISRLEVYLFRMTKVLRPFSRSIRAT